MPDLELAINSSKELISRGELLGTISQFSSYSPCYFFTTECIRAYIEHPFVGGESALSVIGSGDQIFNLAFKGFSKVDGFDINKLTYYNFHLKKAMIMGLSFDEFVSLNKKYWNLFRPQDFLVMFEKIKKFMPPDVYQYYKAMFSFTTDKFTFGGFMNGSCAVYDELANLYANSLENYSKTQKGLENMDVNFYFGDARDIPNKVPGGYDFITLSNISDYLGNPNWLSWLDFRQYIKSYYDLLNPNGSLVNYMYGDYIDNSDISLNTLGLDNIHPVDYTPESFYLVRKPEVCGK